jgi:hypothetical protein
MHTFNYEKFISDGYAITKDGELRVIRHHISKTGHIHVTMKYAYQSAGLKSMNYNKFGRPVDHNSMPFSNSSHLYLVNE